MEIDRVAIVGGTGPQGRGLAARLARAGCTVTIGSRDRARAEATAAALRTATGTDRLHGAENAAAVAGAPVAIVAIPADGLAATLPPLTAALDGKLVIDVVVPLAKQGGRIVHAPPAGAASAGEWLQRLLPASRVVGAFKNVPAEDLEELATPLQGDVLVCGDDADARAAVAALVGRIPDLRAVDAGPLRQADVVEALTALLVNLNRRHGARTSVRILGL